MADKVYPMQERHGPSAPPIGLSDGHGGVALQMPEMAIRKEQEQSLIVNHDINNQKKGRDDQAYYNGGVPATAVSGLGAPVPGRRRRTRRRSCLCCCVVSFLATLVTIVVIVGVAVLVLYLVLRPKAPDFTITDATINELNLTDTLHLNTDMVFSVAAENPNKKISLYYDDVQVQLLYSDHQIGVGSIPAFHQGHKNTTFLTLLIQGHDISLPSATGSALQSSLQNDVSIWLQTKATSKVRVKISGWKSRRQKLHVYCSFQLSSSGGHVSLLSKSCKIKIKFLFFYRTFS